MKKYFYITKSQMETFRLGILFGKELRKGDIVFLTGCLGSGKTVFVKGIAKGLGIKDKIISPTFVLAKEYPEKNFVHLDLYRIESSDFFKSGLDVYFNSDTICAVEWAEKIVNLVNQKFIEVKISILEKEERSIEIKK